MDIDTFKTNFDGGTRPNRFVVEIDMGSYGTIANPFMVKAASMPNDFNDHKDNVVASIDQLSGVGGAFGTATVKQLDMQGNVIRCRQLMRTWPVEVGAIDLSYDVADTLTEYSITLAYDYLQDCQ